MQTLRGEIVALKERMVSDRRWLHQHPETGYDLPETCEYVKNRLVEMGYEPREIVESGLVCTVGDPTPARASCCAPIWMRFP